MGTLGAAVCLMSLQNGRLHEVDGEDEHDAGAERGEHGGGLVAGAVEVGQAVAQEAGQAEADAVEQEAQQAKGNKGERQKNEERGGKDDGEPRAHDPRVRERPGDAAESCDDNDCERELEAARPEPREKAGDGVGRGLDQAAKDEDGTDRANVKQRRQAEEQGGEQAGAEACADGAPGEGEHGVDGEQVAEDGGERLHDGKTGSDAEQAAGETQAEGLQKEDAEQVGGARAHSFEDGEDVHALLEVCVHRHGDADGAKDHGDQANEREQRGGVVKALRERGIAFAIVHHLRVGEGLLEVLAQRLGGDALGELVRQLNDEALGGAAAGRDEFGGVEFLARDEDARTDAGAAGEAIGLLLDHGGDMEGFAAQAEIAADVGVEADEEFVGDGDVGAGERLRERDRGLEVDSAVVGVLGGVDGFERDEERDRIGGDRGHGDRFRDPGGADAGDFLSEGGDAFELGGGGQAVDACAEVAGHEGARFDAEGVAEGLSESADADQRGHADGDGEDDESELAGGGLEVAPGDGGGAAPGEGAFTRERGIRHAGPPRARALRIRDQRRGACLRR